VVLCGNSEVEQQAAMFGLDPQLGRGELFGGLLPAKLAEADLDAVYVPSAPCGGDLPFRNDRGVANYFGVGGYRRPMEDVRRAGVRFASECLGFSNVPDEAAVERVLGPALALDQERQAWKAGVPRDEGADWDFEDVRDHYLRLRYGTDPDALRREDPERYLELSRALSGEVMAEVFGEWRRVGSPCAGGLVLWLRDLVPGAGWGVLDWRGVPKLAYHHLSRALAPVAVWMIDEGLGGVVAHVANDLAVPLHGTLRIALYSGLEICVEELEIPVELPAHGQSSWNVETVIGRFVDASWAYRFGPPPQDAIVATLSRNGGTGVGEVLSQAFQFPAGPPLTPLSPEELGLRARVLERDQERVTLAVSCSRLANGVRLHAEGYQPADDGFCVEPGRERIVALHARDDAVWRGGELGAINLRGRVAIESAAA
jgi:beta-mannosidase